MGGKGSGPKVQYHDQYHTVQCELMRKSRARTKRGEPKKYRDKTEEQQKIIEELKARLRLYEDLGLIPIFTYEVV